MSQHPDDQTFLLFSGPFFRLAYPRHWEMEIIENIPAFYDPEGGGALQVVASRKPDGIYELQEEFDRWLQQQELKIPQERIVMFETEQKVACLACEFVHEERFWMVQLMTAGPALLLVIYNADEVPDRETIEILSVMIRSIRFVESLN